MNTLLAQRAQFIRSFYAVNANAQENTARLLACARQLMNKNDSFLLEKVWMSNFFNYTSIPVEVSGMIRYLKPMIAKADAHNFHYMNETMETSTGSELLVWKEHVLYDTGKEDDKPKDDKPKEETFVNADL